MSKEFTPIESQVQNPTVSEPQERAILDLPIGKPPIDNYVGEYWEGAFLQAKIIPSTAKLQKGLNIFECATDWENYVSTLSQFGYGLSNYRLGGITLVCNADSFPTETFQNDYGASFLQSATDVISPGIQDIMQFTGATSAADAARKIGRLFPEGGMLQAGAGKVATTIEGMQTWANKNVGPAAAVINAMLTGGRVDFPQIWKSSSWAPSYSLSIRLMNPRSGSEEAYEKFIVGPLCALLLLGLPHSAGSAHIYKWPFIHQIEITGLMGVKAAALTSISVSKGGDQAGVAMTQRPWLVDVKLDFVSLYSVLVTSTATQSDAPTLDRYLDVLRGGNKDRVKNYPKTIAPPLGTVTGQPITGAVQVVNFTKSAPSATPDDALLSPTDRVAAEDQLIEEGLLLRQPIDLQGEGALRALNRQRELTRQQAQQQEGLEGNPQKQDTGYTQRVEDAVDAAKDKEGTQTGVSPIDKPKTTSYNSPKAVESFTGSRPQTQEEKDQAISTQQRIMSEKSNENAKAAAAATVNTTVTDPVLQNAATTKQNTWDSYSPTYDYTNKTVSQETRSIEEMKANRAQQVYDSIRRGNIDKGET